jgi:hypothetical protein
MQRIIDQRDTFARIINNDLDKAKLISDLIEYLSHEELTALSYLMYCQKDKIEKETRARLAGKSA